MEPVAQIITPPLLCLSFTVGGIEYTRTDTLALGRARLLEKFLVELQFESTYRGVLSTFDKGWEELNAGRISDGIFSFGLMREKLNLIGSNRHIPAEIVGLFYNAPGEDCTTYQHGAFTEKVYTSWAPMDSNWLKKKALHLLTTFETDYPPESETTTAPGPAQP